MVDVCDVSFQKLAEKVVESSGELDSVPDVRLIMWCSLRTAREGGGKGVSDNVDDEINVIYFLLLR